MRGSMADIQPAMAEITRGKKKEERTNDRAKVLWSALFHRATISKIFCQALDSNQYITTHQAVGVSAIG